MRRAVLLCALVWLCGCQPVPPHQGGGDGAVVALDVSGYGPLHVGMSLNQARAATGQALNSIAIGSENACVEEPFYTADGDTLYAMFEDHRLTRLSLNNQAMHTKTAQNIGIGATDAEVRAAYAHVIEQPAKYNDPPAHDLIVWSDPNKSGIRFEIGADGRVTTIHAGGASIIYVEGCA